MYSTQLDSSKPPVSTDGNPRSQRVLTPLEALSNVAASKTIAAIPPLGSGVGSLQNPTVSTGVKRKRADENSAQPLLQRLTYSEFAKKIKEQFENEILPKKWGETVFHTIQNAHGANEGIKTFQELHQNCIESRTNAFLYYEALSDNLVCFKFIFAEDVLNETIMRVDYDYMTIETYGDISFMDSKIYSFLFNVYIDSNESLLLGIKGQELIPLSDFLNLGLLPKQEIRGETRYDRKKNVIPPDEYKRQRRSSPERPAVPAATALPKPAPEVIWSALPTAPKSLEGEKESPILIEDEELPSDVESEKQSEEYKELNDGTFLELLESKTLPKG